jgi:hypothetical protein
VPRVCRGPGTHWIAAKGGTRTSTVRPGTRCSSNPRLYRTAARRAGRSGSDPAASAAVTAARLAAPRTRSVASPGHGSWPSAARCSFRAAISLPRSGRRGGTAKQASGRCRRRAVARARGIYQDGTPVAGVAAASADRDVACSSWRERRRAARQEISSGFSAIWPHHAPDPDIRSVCQVSAGQQAHGPAAPGCPG